jgi:hypothetical protein
MHLLHPLPSEPCNHRAGELLDRQHRMNQVLLGAGTFCAAPAAGPIA